MENLPEEELKIFRAIHHKVVDDWCKKQAEVAAWARLQGEKFLDSFDGYLEPEQQHEHSEIDVLRMDNSNDSQEAGLNNSIVITQAETSSRVSPEHSSPGFIPSDDGSIHVQDERSPNGSPDSSDEADVRRYEIYSVMERLMKEEHRLTEICLTREKILGRHEDIKALRKEEESTVGTNLESEFEETSSACSSIDEYSLEDDFDENDNNFGYFNADNSFVHSNVYPGVSFQEGVSAVRFEAMLGTVRVNGYIYGQNHPKYEKIVACKEILKHNNIHVPFYDFLLATRQNYGDEIRRPLMERIAEKRIVFQEKVGISLNKAVSTARMYGVTRFLRDFYRQIFEIAAYVHQREFRTYII